jgi:hypothetical protein
MALTEQRVLKQITVLSEVNAINVQWADQIVRDGVVVSETFCRKAYGPKQKDEFLEEVENANLYTTILGWM